VPDAADENDTAAATAADRKRKRIRRVQRYFLNPPVRLATWAGIVPGNVLVETVGRRSGKRRQTPVGMKVDGDTGWVVSEHGRKASYVRNIEAQPDVRVRIGRRWREAQAHVVPDDDVEARLAWFGRAGHVAAVRRFGTDLVSVRFDFPPSTTRQ